MNSSNTSNGQSRKIQKPSDKIRTGAEVLITSSTSELVEFYWSNQKYFSGGFKGFPIELKKIDVKAQRIFKVP